MLKTAHLPHRLCATAGLQQPGFGPVTVQPAQRPTAQPHTQPQPAAAAVQEQPGAQAKPAAGGSVPDAAGAASGAEIWTEHTAPDGRKYYYNKALNKSSWEKPAALVAAQVCTYTSKPRWPSRCALRRLSLCHTFFAVYT